MTTTWFIVARAIHIGACLLFFGMLAFDRCVASSIFTGRKTEAEEYWQACLRSFTLILLPVLLVSGIGWFVFVSGTMSDEPLQWGTLKIVWAQTQFGMVWKLRLILWFAALFAFMLFQCFKPSSKNLITIQFLLAGTLLCSLAWAGHGREDSPWHLIADGLHLLVAGFWPAGLLPLMLLLKKFRRVPPIAGEKLI